MKIFEYIDLPHDKIRDILAKLDAAWQKNKCADYNGGQPMAKNDYSHRIEAIAQLMDSRVYRNGTYQVIVNEKTPGFMQLTISRTDGLPARNWKELQMVKNLLVGKEHEGVELFPAESRRRSTAHQHYMYVTKAPTTSFPFGFPAGGKLSEYSVDDLLAILYDKPKQAKPKARPSKQVQAKKKQLNESSAKRSSQQTDQPN